MRELVLPTLIAHRGASDYAPENTLAALQKAHELHMSWVEFDVRLTADNRPIIFHDDELERVTNGQGSIEKTSYKKISLLDAGGWFSEKYRDEKIPTLGAWLQRAAQLNMGINIELKLTKQHRVAKLAEQVMFGISQFWRDDLPPPLLSSFSHSALAAIRKRDTKIYLGYLVDAWRESIFPILERYHCVSLHVQHTCLLPERVALLKQFGYKVVAFTVNDKQRAKELLSMGVDALITNGPLLLQE